MSTYLIAGQAAPVANQVTTLFQVPDGKQFVSSSLVVCNGNSSGSVISVDIAVVPNGGTLGNGNYLFKNYPVNGRDSKSIVIGMTLAAGDAVIVKSSDGSTAFTLFGNLI